MGRQRVGLPLIMGRMVAILGMGFAATIAILLLVGGFWREGLVSVVVTLFFLALMFLVERWAERG
ncbi:MAG: hypothetical protein ACUVV3_02215 [Dehalococcoidia bacterium]